MSRFTSDFKAVEANHAAEQIVEPAEKHDFPAEWIRIGGKMPEDRTKEEWLALDLMIEERRRDRRETPPAGLYQKFVVTRTDGQSDPGQKHYGCSYFVLDLDHDPAAAGGLEGYAAECANPILEEQLLTKVLEIRRRIERDK